MKHKTLLILLSLSLSSLLPTSAQRPLSSGLLSPDNGGVGGGGQGGAVTMSLSDCLTAAHENNLTLRSGKISIERARDLQGTNFDLDNTDISLAQTPTTGGGPENALSFSQTFAFPTVYGARRSKLKAETALEEARYAVDVHTLDRDVELSYQALRYALEQRRLLAVQDTIYARFLRIAEARHDAGESSALEHISARRLYEENRVAMNAATQSVGRAQLRLALLLNTDQLILPAEATFAPLPTESVPLASFNAASVPAVALASQSSVVAEQNLRLARQAFLPDISIGASTQLLIKGFNPYNVDRSRFTEGNFMGFDVGISIPLFYGGKRARLKAAKKEVEQSRLLAEQETKAATARYRLAQSELAQARERLTYYEHRGNADAAETYRLSQLAYEKGDIAYVEYIQNLQAALAQQMAYAEAVNAYNQAAVSLKYIAGNK